MQTKKPVFITKITEIKNGAYQLALSQEIIRENQTGALTAMLMEGHPGFGPRKPAVSWQNVSEKKMNEIGFKIGDDLSSKLGFEVNLQVEETTDPSKLWSSDQFTFVNKEGKKVSRQPKTNPATGAVLMYDNKPIYRKVVLVKGEAKHSYVQHNGIYIPAKVSVMVPNDSVLGD